MLFQPFVPLKTHNFQGFRPEFNRISTGFFHGMWLKSSEKLLDPLLGRLHSEGHKRHLDHKSRCRESIIAVTQPRISKQCLGSRKAQKKKSHEISETPWTAGCPKDTRAVSWQKGPFSVNLSIVNNRKTPVCPAGCCRDTWPVSREFS